MTAEVERDPEMKWCLFAVRATYQEGEEKNHPGGDIEISSERFLQICKDLLHESVLLWDGRSPCSAWKEASLPVRVPAVDAVESLARRKCKAGRWALPGRKASGRRIDLCGRLFWVAICKLSANIGFTDNLHLLCSERA